MEGQAYFPLFVDMSDRQVLIVGAGAVGLRRAQVLAQFGAKVRVVAPECVDSTLLKKPQRKKPEQSDPRPGTIEWIQRGFQPADIDGCFLVIAATDDEAVNSRIVSLCRKCGICVNHAGDQSQCDFYFPAIVREESLVIGVTASGLDHRLVRRVAAELRGWLNTYKKGKK